MTYYSVNTFLYFNSFNRALNGFILANKIPPSFFSCATAIAGAACNPEGVTKKLAKFSTAFIKSSKRSTVFLPNSTGCALYSTAVLAFSPKYIFLESIQT